MKKVLLIFMFVILMSSLVTASIVIENTKTDGGKVVITITDLNDPEVRDWFNDYMSDENHQIVRTEVDDQGVERTILADTRLQDLQGKGAIAVSGLQVGKRNTDSYASVTQFLSAVIIFVLVAVPLMILGYELARKR